MRLISATPGSMHLHGAAADGFAIEVCNEEAAATFGDFLGIEAEEVCIVFGIAGIQFGVERSDQLSSGLGKTDRTADIDFDGAIIDC